MRRAFFALALLALGACQPLVHYYHYQPVDPLGWALTDTLLFTVPVSSNPQPHNVSLGIRFREQQRYRDLYLVLEQRLQHGAALRDTLHLHLANERGRWQARGVVLHEHEVAATPARLDTLNPTTFLVYHVQGPQIITGITEVGLKVE